MIRQDVLKKTTDELFGWDGREFDLIGGRLLVRESDLSIFELEDALVADGNAKEVRGQIFESGFSRAHRLTMNHPIFVPSRLIDEGKQVGLLELIPEFGAEENRERFDVNQEVQP